MATLKLYPVGIQTFERIRKEDLLYVDKTEYVYRMTHTSGKYFFLSRPRRFGKSLLTSTFHSYFEGKKELFKGLAIEKLEKEWTEYPVLHFDLSGGKHLEKEQLEDYLSNRLEKEEKKWGITQPKRGANDRLTELITTAYEKTGKQVVVLIDEYDAPLLDVVHEETSLKVLRNIMRNFYSPLKMCEPYLRFVFLTGITKFSQMSIFSELNNISNVSMDEEYAGICGITKEELVTEMSADIDALGEKLGKTREETIASLREYYDGYHFAAKSPDIFNPIRVGLYRSLLPNYIGMNTVKGTTTIAKMSAAIRRNNIDGALEMLQTYLATVPYCDNTDYEGHYQQMMYVIFSILDNYVDVEVHTPRGRVDMVLRTATHLYLFELKLNQSSDVAMKQINLKEYAKRFSLCGLPIVKVGINFDLEKHTISDWSVEEN